MEAPDIVRLFASLFTYSICTCFSYNYNKIKNISIKHFSLFMYWILFVCTYFYVMTIFVSFIIKYYFHLSLCSSCIFIVKWINNFSVHSNSNHFSLLWCFQTFVVDSKKIILIIPIVPNIQNAEKINVIECVAFLVRFELFE